MPSPVGHALGGLAAGWLIAGGPRGRNPEQARHGLLFSALAVAPDLDLLAGTHRGVTHSLGAAVAAGLAVWLWTFWRGRPEWRLALAAGAAWGSHVLLDWLGADTSPPVGVMALWPFSSGFYEAPVHVFLAISRRVHQPEHFWIPNLLALVRELAILAPLALLAARTPGRRNAASASPGREAARTDRPRRHHASQVR